MTREDRIAEILGHWQDQRDEGTFVDTDALCAEHPELADELRLRLAALNIVEQAYAESRMFDGDAPKRLGEFEIVRELGRGGMGVVYEAVQTSMKRTVALKVLFPSVTSSRRAIERFQREARAAGRVQHTNIVPVYSLSREAGTWYYAMELVEGSSLSTLIRQMRDLGDEPGEEHWTLLETLRGTDVPEAPSEGPEEALRETSPTASRLGETRGSVRYHRDVALMFADVADALQAAHDEGVIHRDIKPSNLILDEKGVLKIVDFGIARIGSEASGMTITGEVLGTPIYMSPEQARARAGDIDHRTDIYSLGASLYEVLTLRTPFTGTSFPDVYRQILTTQPVAPRRHSRSIPRDLETIVTKAMEKEPGRRYASAGALSRDLRAFASGFGIEARRVGPVMRALRVVKRHPIRGGLAAGLVLALTTAAYLGWRGAVQEERRIDLEYAALLAGAESVTSSPRTSHDPLERYFREQRAERDSGLLAAFDEAIALAPGRSEAWLRRALASSRTKGERLSDLHEASGRGAFPQTVHLAHSLILLENHEFAAAEVHDREMPHVVDASPLDSYLQARLQVERGAWRAALATLTGLFERGHLGRFERTQALLMRARVHARLGNRIGAVEDLAAYQKQGGASRAVQVRLAWHWHCLTRVKAAEKIFVATLEATQERGDAGAWLDLADACKEAGARHWRERATRLAVAQHPRVLPLLLARFSALKGASLYEDALRVAQEAVDLAPDDALALWARGTAHLERSERWKAWLDLRRASELRPNDVAILGSGARVLRSQGHYRRALDLNERMLALAPHDAWVWRAKARTLEKVRKFDGALSCLAQALTLDPSHAGTLVDKATILRKAGRNGEASDVVDEVRGREALDAATLARIAAELNNQKRRAEAIEVSERAFALDAELTFAHYTHAHALFWEGRVQEAKDSCLRALAIDPGDRTTRNFLGHLTEKTDGRPATLVLIDGWLKDRPRDPRIWQWYGHVLLRSNRIEAGLAAFRTATELEPGNPDLHLNLYTVLVNETRMDEALNAARAASRVAPGDPHMLGTVAGMLNTAKRYDEALALLDRVLEIDPEDGGAYAFRAYALRFRGDLAAALATATKGTEVDPLDCATWEHRAHTLFELGRVEEALDDYNRCLALRPDSEHPAEMRASALLRLGRTKEAFTAARELVKKHPRRAVALNVLGNILTRMGEHKESLKVLLRARELLPRDAAILGNLGYTLMRLGRMEGAVDALKASVAIRPSAFSLDALAGCYVALGRADDALQTWKESVEQKPPQWVPHLNLMRALMQRRRYEECARWALTTAQRFPSNAAPHFLRARSLHYLGLSVQAAGALAAGEKLVTDDDARGQVSQQDTLLVMGRHEQMVQNFMGLQRALTLWAAKQPGNDEFSVGLADARIDYAIALWKTGRTELAEAAFLTALGTCEALLVKEPKSIQAQMLVPVCKMKYSWLLWEQGKEAEACELATDAADRLIALEREGHEAPAWAPNGARVLFLLARADARAGRFEAAKIHARQSGEHGVRYKDRFPSEVAYEGHARAFLNALALASGERKPAGTGDHAALADWYLRIEQLSRAYRAYKTLLADPLGRQYQEGMHLYNAACVAARLAGGAEDDTEASRLHTEAMMWLTQYVEDWKNRIAKPPPDVDPAVRAGLLSRFEAMRQHALKDSDLARLRDTPAFKKLFEQEQRPAAGSKGIR